MRMRLIASLILFCLLISSFSLQIVSADGGIFTIDYDEHVYLPHQKAAIFWDGNKETMIISTKIQSENLTDLAWVVPVSSSVQPEVDEGDVQIFNQIAVSFSEYSGGGFFGDICLLTIVFLIVGLILLITALLKRKTKLFTLLIILSLLFLIIMPTIFVIYTYTSGTIGGGGDVDVVEMKSVDFYDIAILKATNATSMVSWLNSNGFIIPDNAIDVLQDYCDKENFYFIVNKIDMSNSDDLAITLNNQIKAELDEIKEYYNILLNSDINYFEIKEAIGDDFNHFIVSSDYMSEVAYEIFTGKSYNTTPLKQVFNVLNLSEDEFNSLVPQNLVDNIYSDYLKYPYSGWIMNTRATLIFKWNEEGEEKTFTIPNKKPNEKLTWNYTINLSLGNYDPIYSLDDTSQNFLFDSAQKMQDLYYELIDKRESSEYFDYFRDIYDSENYIDRLITDFTHQFVNINIDEETILNDDFLTNETLQQWINTRDQQIKEDLENGIATPLKIVFYPNKPMYPMKMSSINEGNTKINVYFISDYYVKDESELLVSKGESNLTSTYYTYIYSSGENITWMTFEGDTKDLIADSYFIKKE